MRDSWEKAIEVLQTIAVFLIAGFGIVGIFYVFLLFEGCMNFAAKSLR